MSLVDQISPALEEEIDPSLIGDPFRLGHRWLRRTLPDGTEESYQIPLTLDDLLFPEEEDHPVQIGAHTEDCVYLLAVLKLQMAAIPNSLVMMDHRVDFDVPDVRPLGPDVAVFLNVADPAAVAGTLYMGEMPADPALVVEIASADTRQMDLRIKKDLYYQAGVACYVVVNSKIRAASRKEAWLVGYRYTPDGYEPIPIDDQGRLWVAPLNLWLKIVDRQIRCIDGATGELIEPFVEQVFARQAAEARALVATAAQLTAEEQARTAEEQARAATTARLAAEAQARAELATRVDLEAQMAAMQAELRRLRGEG